jgi:hypothetical protein
MTLHCDGSVKDGNGAFAWIISAASHTIVHHRGPVVRNPMTPFRAKCFCATSVLTFLSCILSLHSIASMSSVTLYIDCQAILPYVSYEPIAYAKNSPFRKDYDISHQAHITFQSLTMTIPGITSGQYVKAHQPITQDSKWETILNADCDEAAKQFRRSHDYSTPGQQTASPFPSLTHKGDIITGNEIHTTRWAWQNRV